MPLDFEWDNSRAASNRKKHDVAFEEAASVFDDPLAAVFRDDEHAIGEQREILVGNSILGRTYTGLFCAAIGRQNTDLQRPSGDQTRATRL